MSVIRTVCVETFIKRCVREGGCGHAVDEIVGSGQRLGPEECREMRLMKEGDDSLNEVTVFAFGNTILFRSIGARCVMNNTKRLEKRAKGSV